MSRSLKLGLDLVFGLLIPIFILSRLSEPLGAIPAYLLAALIPVGWVTLDLLFITRRFNFITSFLAMNAILRGVLAFWFVDGVQYALKDSAPSLLLAVLFGGSLLVGRPLLYYFSAQALDPRTEEQSRMLDRFLSEGSIRKSLWYTTAALTVVSLVTTAANFFLNLEIVTAAFGTDEFNAQVARANAIARVAIAIPEALAMGIAIAIVFRTIYSQLPDAVPEASEVPEDPDSGTPDKREEPDFWELLQSREETKSESPEREDPQRDN